jgi:general secretion pathway protein J
MKKHFNRDHSAGFALIESIAVLALAALVFLTLLIATDLVSRNAQATARRADIIETLMTGLGAARRDLEGTRFVRTGSKAEDPVLFSGSSSAVAIAVGDDDTGLGHGESLVLIEARYENDRGVLVRSSARLLPGTRGFGSVDFGNSAILVAGPWRYQFSYADLEAGAERWRSNWTATARIPAAVRIEVLDSSGKRVVPPMTVHVAVNSGGCADAVRDDCNSDVAESKSEPAQQVDQPGEGNGQVPR